MTVKVISPERSKLLVVTRADVARKRSALEKAEATLSLQERYTIGEAFDLDKVEENKLHDYQFDATDKFIVRYED